jgi:hydrogenase maturation protein HypF
MAAAALHASGRSEEIAARWGAKGEMLAQMLVKGLNAAPTTSLGRVFDAAAGLLGLCEVQAYEAEAAMRLESLTSRPRTLEGAWQVDRERRVLDLKPLLAALTRLSPENGADLFHGTLAAALVDWAVPVLAARGERRIGLTGGCLANKVLTEELTARFAAEGIEAILHRAVPSNDGGLSLGQAWAAGLTLATQSNGDGSCA